MKRILATIGICFGSALVALMLSAVTTALPTIRSELGATFLQIQWVINVAAISRGSLVATIGTLADMLGRRRIFLSGLALLSASALLAGFAPSSGWLVLAMGGIGIANAALLVSSQSLLIHLYDDKHSGRALAFWSVALGLGIALGALLAGGILEAGSWRWVYWAMIPLAVVIGGLVYSTVNESRDEGRSKQIDWIGLLLLTVSIGALVTAIIQGKVWGWTSWETMVLFVGGGLGGVAFLWVETHTRFPLLQLKLFMSRMFIAGAITNLCFVCFMLTTLFLTPLFLYLVLGAEPIHIGLSMLALALPIVVLGPLAGLRTERHGPKAQIVLGLLMFAGGSLWMTTLTAGTHMWAMLLPLVVYGIGWAAMQGAAAMATITSLPKELAGAASGGFVMMGGIGGAIGLAVAGTIVRSVYSAELGLEPTPEAFAEAYHAGMWFLFGVSVVALVTVVGVMKNGRQA